MEGISEAQQKLIDDFPDTGGLRKWAQNRLNHIWQLLNHYRYSEQDCSYLEAEIHILKTKTSHQWTAKVASEE